MTPEINQTYQHKYGGLYIVRTHVAESTVDGSEWVVYTHVWPFEENTYIRPYAEFIDGRFKKLSDEDVRELLAKDREEFQWGIVRAKAMSRDK